jgi:hypothetical protein
VLINNCRTVGYLRVVARIKFVVNGQVSNPQSATIHSTIRCAQANHIALMTKYEGKLYFRQ